MMSETFSNFYAVLIGFNEYKDQEHLHRLQFAEKDALDMYELLTDPEIGNYSKEHIKLITGSTIPVDRATEEIERLLYQHVVKDRTPDDTVVVYFSGHGFIAGDAQQAYLATPDVTILDILNNPRCGLEMEFIHNDIFMATKAKYAVFVLDCCHSGAFVPNFNKGEGDPDEKSLLSDRLFSGEGRVAFVSSQRGVVSRESREFQNSVFTYYLLKGMRGEASEPYSGEVTMNSLVPYVQHMAPSNQQPVRYGKDVGRIVLTRPTAELQVTTGYSVKPFDYMAAHFTQGRKTAIDNPLYSPIDQQTEYIDHLLSCLETVKTDDRESIGTRILSSVRCSVDADFAFIERVDPKEGMISKVQSDFPLTGMQLEEFRDAVLDDLRPVLIRDKNELRSTRFGVRQPYDRIKGEGKSIVAIPLHIDRPREFLILCGLREEYLGYGEILGRTLASLYQATGELVSLSIPKIETAILDDLRLDYGYLPHRIYVRRKKLFDERLKTIQFHFEPVVSLGKRNLEIDSWEALARDPDASRAPADMFQAAELWGSEFITELDLYCLRNALSTYIKLWKKEREGQKVDPISINVYPETLFRKVYMQELHRITKEEELIRGHQLYLEISEKRPIPLDDRYPSNGANEIELFGRRLNEYSTQLNVGFAIDDFGVGHSSVARIARLQPAYVKIDRDVLHHDNTESTIKYVLELVHKAHSHPTKVVVEGFDGDSHISLAALYSFGIGHIQGHIVRRASQSVRDLEPEKREFLTRLVNG